MTIEEKMKVVRKALEKGAHVQLSFHNLKSKEEAKEIITSFEPHFNRSSEQHKHEKTHWYEITDETDEEIEIELAAYYDHD